MRSVTSDNGRVTTISGRRCDMLLRDALGETLRDARNSQSRTLRDVSTAANVSLGYLSEVERGRKEASSELLASICDALDLQMSDVLDTVSRNLRADARLAAAKSRVTENSVKRGSGSGADHRSGIETSLRIVLPYGAGRARRRSPEPTALFDRSPWSAMPWGWFRLWCARGRQARPSCRRPGRAGRKDGRGDNRR